MVGKRQFDEGMVVDAVLEVFWRQGYAATSIDDLVRATGLGRGSLYGAFGNKTELFLRAVEHYRMKVGQWLTLPSGLEPRQAIQTVFDRSSVASCAAQPRNQSRRGQSRRRPRSGGYAQRVLAFRD